MNNKIYECKTGKYTIICKEPSVNGRSMVRVKFIETGNEYIVRKDHALIGNVRDPAIKPGRIPAEIDYARIYNTNYGPVKIVRELQDSNSVPYNQRFVEIEFLNTGYRKIVQYHSLKNAKDFVNLRDDSVYNEKHLVGTDKLYNSNNYGPFKIIRYTGDIRGSDPIVEIEFVATGYKTTVPMGKALYGIVRDPYYPTIYGVGYCGTNTDVTNNKRLYNIWVKILSRCYNPDDPHYNIYGGAGVTVDPRWFNFSVFVEDIKYLDGYNLMVNDTCNYVLDKDLKQLQFPRGERVYSKDTCTFITRSDNSKIRCYEPNYNPYETLIIPDLTISNSLKTMVEIVENKMLKYK